MLRCLGSVYSIATFIRDLRTLLQIRQVAQLRSTTCSLQGLSSTQRSTQAAPSRDLTLGVKEQKRNPKRLSVPRSRKSTREDRIERNPKVAVLPPMGEGHQPVVVGIGGVEKGARAIGGKNPPSQHSVSPTYDEGVDSAGVGDGKDRRSHPGCGPRGGSPLHRARLRYLHLQPHPGEG